MGDILHNRDATGRISKRAVELGALEINFKPRTAIKSQALVDFLAEWWENQIPAPQNIPEHWVMYFDGSLKIDGGGAGVLFISPKGEQLKYVFQILFKVSNNEAEYEALLHGLRLAVSLGIKRLLVYGIKSIKNGTSTRIQWTHTLMKSESSKTSFQDWKSTTSTVTTMWELMSSPNLGPLEQLFHQEFLSMNSTTHQSNNKTNKPLT